MPRDFETLLIEFDDQHIIPTRIVYVWALVFLAIIFYAMAWYVFGWVIMEYISAVEAAYTFQPPLDSVVSLIKNVIAWHPIIALLGWILWGFLNSMRRDIRTYEV